MTVTCKRPGCTNPPDQHTRGYCESDYRRRIRMGLHDHQPALAYHPPLPAREPDWIDARMSRSVRLFAGPDAPLDTPARRRLAGATLRRAP